MKKKMLLTAVLVMAVLGLGMVAVVMGEEADESSPEEDETQENPEMGHDGRMEMFRVFMENDLDGDGIANCEDPDDDGDGLTDTEDEFPHDHDNDGIPDGRDDDDDNDGIPDGEDDEYVGNPPELPPRKGPRDDPCGGRDGFRHHPRFRHICERSGDRPEG